jgi:hypothetical protein
MAVVVERANVGSKAVTSSRHVSCARTWLAHGREKACNRCRAGNRLRSQKWRGKDVGDEVKVCPLHCHCQNLDFVMDPVEFAGRSSFVDEMIAHLLLLFDDTRNRLGNAAAESMLLANEISHVFCVASIRLWHTSNESQV